METLSREEHERWHSFSQKRTDWSQKRCVSKGTLLWCLIRVGNHGWYASSRSQVTQLSNSWRVVANLSMTTLIRKNLISSQLQPRLRIHTRHSCQIESEMSNRTIIAWSIITANFLMSSGTSPGRKERDTLFIKPSAYIFLNPLIRSRYHEVKRWWCVYLPLLWSQRYSICGLRMLASGLHVLVCSYERTRWRKNKEGRNDHVEEEGTTKQNPSRVW